MATMDFEYVIRNINYGIFLDHFRNDTVSLKYNYLTFWNSCNFDDDVEE
jgi:hypothetical protein